MDCRYTLLLIAFLVETEESHLKWDFSIYSAYMVQNSQFAVAPNSNQFAIGDGIVVIPGNPWYALNGSTGTIADISNLASCQFSSTMHS